MTHLSESRLARTLISEKVVIGAIFLNALALFVIALADTGCAPQDGLTENPIYVCPTETRRN